jgi:hypothetical protein
MCPTAQERIDKWIEKWSGDSKPVAISEDYKTKMIARLTPIFEMQVDVENAVRLILAEAGTATIMNGAYHSFGKQVMSLAVRFSGGQLLNIVDVKMNTWVARGLDQDILEKIRNTVFAIAAPAP